METIDLGAGRTGIVDYAHTPDALANVLRTVRDLAPHRVITVFGCGGDRDVGKRQPMGEIASQLSDVCIVTSDNPRFEDPLKIIEDIIQGCRHQQVWVEPDRSQAIAMACRLSQDGDIVLVAGKGHERYQLVGEAMVPFSDREILQQCATLKP
jgi:UDP-N-acetylmuramoyl-L-alanyl-D-glutamate--2,6-diaminopimelate ligase